MYDTRTEIEHSTNILNKTISSNEISFSDSCVPDSSTPKEYNSDTTEVCEDDSSLPFIIYNYVYNKRPSFSIMHAPFWQAFKTHHPSVSLTPIELKMHFFEDILPNSKHFVGLTSYQKKYFATMQDFYGEFDLEKLRKNDPIPGLHYHRADDNDTFISLVKQPDINIIGVTENVNYDIYNDANSNRLFKMNEDMRLCYSSFLRNADEIENNVVLEHNEIKKRLRVYFAEGKTLPEIADVTEILKSNSLWLPDTPRTSSVIMSFSSTSSQSRNDSVSSASPADNRSELGAYFDKISGDITLRARKPKRDTKTLRKMQDSLRNPKLKELERKARLAKQKFRKYL